MNTPKVCEILQRIINQKTLIRKDLKRIENCLNKGNFRQLLNRSCTENSKKLDDLILELNKAMDDRV